MVKSSMLEILFAFVTFTQYLNWLHIQSDGIDYLFLTLGKETKLV